MAYTVTQSFFKVDTRGNHTRVDVGTRLTNTEYNKLNKIKQAKCSPITETRQATYSQSEADYLVELYLNVAGLNNQVAAFLAKYPQRVEKGVECQLRIIAGQDNTTDDSGLQNPSEAFLRAMLTQSPARFV
tara:strand:- start:79 stop:471 length:393 start_codon:yes stop_codon:yes gene_type:complete